MRAFVTGATGFVGGRVAEHLLEAGWDVDVLARTPAKAARLADRGARVVPGDVTEPDTYREAIRGADAVLHFAAILSLSNRERARMLRTNVEGARNVLRAAADADVPRILHCGSVAALGASPDDSVGDETREHDGRYVTVYEETKHLAHRMVLDMAREGVPVVTVLPAGVYGSGDGGMMGMMLRWWAAGKLLVCPFQNAGVSWVHVGDVADGSLRALERGTAGEAYILGGENETVGGLLRRVAAVTGLRKPLPVPGPLVKLGYPFDPLIARLMRQPRGSVVGGMRTLRGCFYFSSAKAARELGYSYRSLEEGMPDALGLSRSR